MSGPLTPQQCDLTDFAFMPLDVARLFASEFHAVASDVEWRAGVTLWAKSWHQVPAASLPDDDIMLARLAEFGRDTRSWKKARAGALRGWIKADDGRLYHPVVAEKALEAWLEKLAQRLSSGAGNAKRWKAVFDPAPIQVEVDRAVEMLTALAPHSRSLAKSSRRQSRKHPAGTPDDGPGVIPSGSQGTGTGIYTSSNEEEAGASSVDPNAKAWADAKALLRGSGGMSAAKAGAFFGGLLKDNPGLEARDLLAAIAQATANGTQDPQAYLTKAAASVGRRRSGQPAPSAPVAAVDWRERVSIWRDTGQWLIQWGAEPGDPQCQCPADLLEAS